MNISNEVPTNKVVTITLNPALDLTGSLQQLTIGSVNLVNKGSLHPAGKGVNVAKVLSDLGADVTVTGFLGKENDTLFRQLFLNMRAKDKFIRVEGSTRINVKLVEDNGDVSDINFPGISISEQEIKDFEDNLFKLANTHQFFVLAGSLPPGISPSLCASWIEKLHQRGKKVLFDSSHSALSAGIEAHPWLIKPNDDELSDFIGTPLKTIAECRQVAEKIATKGIDNIVVSLGAKGVMWLRKAANGLPFWQYSQPPKLQVVSTVGAGDTLVAGFCWGSMQNWQAEQTLSFSTALSALAVSQVGVGVPCLPSVIKLQKEIILSNT